MFFEGEVWIGTVDGYLMLYRVINHDIVDFSSYNNRIFSSDKNLINKEETTHNEELLDKSSIASQSR